MATNVDLFLFGEVRMTDAMPKSRILIADDNPTNVELLEAYLGEIDCEVAAAGRPC